MIWLWIGAAVALSWLFCRKKVAWYHYIWMLLPIEMYGINVAGATIKPYMVFGLLIVLYNIRTKKNRRIPAGIVLFTLALITSNLLTGVILDSVKIHLMVLIVVVIAYNYCLIAQNDSSFFENISTVMMATTIGYGIVFLVTYLIYRMDPSFGQIFTLDRYSDGIFLGFETASREVVVRLRGFCMDPNPVITTLSPGAIFAFEKLANEKIGRTYSIITILMFSCVAILSGSRMAMICWVVMAVVMMIISYKQSKFKGRMVAFSLLLFLVMVPLVACNYQKINVFIYNYFNSRAGLNDDAGRFTIWKYNINWLINNNRLFFGVGQNQISRITELGKAFHNTWLEWISGTGIVIGIGICIWFLLAPIQMVKQAKRIHIEPYRYIPLIVAYMIIAICITTVNDIANSAFVFLMVIFRYGFGQIENDRVNEMVRI